LSPKQQYDAAYALLQDYRIADAERALSQFISRFPNDDLTHNARYWLGETYYARALYQQAAAAFFEAFQRAPSGSKAPDNLLKLGLALGHLSQRQEACATLTELAIRFPSADNYIRQQADSGRQRFACSAIGAAAQAATNSAQLTGTVTTISASSRTVRVAGSEYHFPPGTSMAGLGVGQVVTLTYAPSTAPRAVLAWTIRSRQGQEASVTGAVTALSAQGRTITLGGVTYSVPPSVDMAGLAVSTRVTIVFGETGGTRMVGGWSSDSLAATLLVIPL
jgi:tol-pal system protein YbgF